MDEQMNPLEGCPDSPDGSSCDIVGDIMAAGGAKRRSASPLSPEDRKHVAFSLMDDDDAGGATNGPTDDLGSDDVVDPDDAEVRMVQCSKRGPVIAEPSDNIYFEFRLFKMTLRSPL